MLVRRTLDVPVPPAAAWERLSRVEEWPSWARHLRSARLEPPGALGPRSRGVFLLRPGIPTRFAMTDWDPPRRWRWKGRFLWLHVGYDHRFEPLPGGGTRIVLEVDGAGFALGTLGRLFAAAYARNLDRALPRLALEMGSAVQ
jgi:polyketide cyclase/dehydrase/lipid transport protein